MPAADRAATPQTVSGPIYVPTFDAFRGGAVLVIVAYHLCLRSGWIPPGAIPRALMVSGFMSLDLLFLISGFVMFLPVAARGTLGDLRAFAVRRVARIAPAYYVSLLVLLALFPFLRGNWSGPAPWDPLALAAHLAFLHNMVAFAYPAYFPGFGVNPAVWTLSVEMLFYVVLAVVAVGYLRRPLLGLAIAIAITVIWRVALDPPNDFATQALGPGDLHILWKQLPLFAVDFAAGMTGAWALVRLRRGPELERARRLAPAVCIVSGVAVVVLFALVGATLTDSRAPLIIAGAGFQEATWLAVAIPLAFATFAVSTDFLSPRGQWPFSNRLSRWVGEVSYSVYLYHLIVVQFALEVLGFGHTGTFSDFVALAVFTLPIALMIGWISYVTIERPVRLRAQRLSRRLQAGGSRSAADAATAPAR